jgi:hypothetical protein
MADQARRRGCRIRLLRAARLLGRPALPPPHVAVSPMADRPHRGAACGDEQVQSTSVWGPTIRRSRRLSGPPKKAAACLTSITRWPCRRSGGPPEQSSGFRPRGNDGNLSQILRSAGLHRGSPPSESGGFRNARFYWVFRTSRLGGGEGGILTPLTDGATTPILSNDRFAATRQVGHSHTSDASTVLPRQRYMHEIRAAAYGRRCAKALTLV